MIPLHLYIENFLCHEKSYVDFTQFSSALVVGKIDGNDSYSNGVGKTTIFKGIEYVLFNMSDVNLEKLIRDDANSCKITFIFKSNDQIYRVSRTRTKKGTSDLSLFERNATEGDDKEVYSESVDSAYWKDISGRRAPDTEKDLAKLIKINSKAFRNTVHFAQNDFTGLTTATPEKRKSLLREALSLSIYSKLEKISKDKHSLLNKEIDKLNNILHIIGDPEEDVKNLKSNKEVSDIKLIEYKEEEANLILESKSLQEKIQKTSAEIEKNINDNKLLLSNKEKVTIDKSNIEKSLKEFVTKKNKNLEEAKLISSNIKKLKAQKEEIQAMNLKDVTDLSKEIDSIKSEMMSLSLQKKNLSAKIEELSLPLPEGSNCKHCRQTLSSEHIESCKQEIEIEIKDCKEKISQINTLSTEKNKLLLQLTEENKQTIEKQNTLKECIRQLEILESEIVSKKEIYNDYNKIIKDYEIELKNKIFELEKIENGLNQSSLEKNIELNQINKQYQNNLSTIEKSIALKANQINELSNSLAVLEHSIKQKETDIDKKKELNKEIKKINKEQEIYPKVIESFSSYGIPNLIIQNLLDDLQEESNKLLNSLKPGLQLQFVVEKEKKDGTSNDTLDILYFVQGKAREFEQLSGAMKLAVNFSLKIGLSFLLQKTFDTNINFLLLDEIDQSLDKAGVDAFADIVKFFQKDFTILVVTHNDNLKNKFSHAILVEQDKNMISRASVVTNW